MESSTTISVKSYDYEEEIINYVTKNGGMEKTAVFLLWLEDEKNLLENLYEEEENLKAALTRAFESTCEEDGECYSNENIEGEYRILTEDEADEAWEESLDNYIEECILPEIPKTYHFYFDEKAWKRDARMDGRGHALNSYDGTEYEIKFNDAYYFIYREN